MITFSLVNSLFLTDMCTKYKKVGHLINMYASVYKQINSRINVNKFAATTRPLAKTELCI